ncbi:hypothetical protein F5887DRAFT_532733 [Amanita rubescens]|nr:hypothetical protein F5887DRAFT_532733 [Amanita rubescens]
MVVPGVSPDTSAIAAWQSAPTDIIQEIFKYFSCPLHILTNGRSSTTTFPWYLGHICSAWRTVFRSMSTEFWSTFRLFKDWKSYDTSVNDIVALAKVFLECNRGQLFSFNIQVAIETDILQVFIPESARWLDASISAHQEWGGSILSPVKDRLPHLRSLELKLWRTSPPNSQNFLDQDCFKIVPNLTYVKSNAVREWQFDWSNVTTLVLTGALEPWFLEIIPTLRNLEKLVIPVLKGTLEDYNKLTILTFPRLRVLRTLEPMILSVLQCPSLEQLYIDDSTSLFGLEPMGTSFLDRSECTLKNLYIGHSDPTGAFPAILKRSPDIKSLTMRVSGRSPHRYHLHYEHLTCRPNIQSLVPRLKALTMVSPYNSTNDNEGFTAMLASRTIERLPFVEQLQQVTVVSDSRTPIPDVFQQISEKYGVNFNFVYYDCWHIKGNDISWDLEDDNIKWSSRFPRENLFRTTLNNKLQGIADVEWMM